MDFLNPNGLMTNTKHNVVTLRTKNKAADRTKSNASHGKLIGNTSF